MRPGDEPLLRDHEALAFLAEQRLGAESHVLVEDLGVAAEHPEVLVRVLHVGHVAHDVHARRVGRDDEHRRALVRRRVGVGHGHHDQEVGDRAVRREPLVPVEDPAVAVAHGARPQLRRVGAGCLGLGHRERRLAARPRAAGRASAPSARACRRARGSRCCRSRAPGSRTRSARRTTCRGSRASGRASPGRSPGRRARAADGRPTGPVPSPAAAAARRSGRAAPGRCRRSIASIGQISSRTNSRIHASCSSNSGSVEKSHATARSFRRVALD